MPAETLRCAFCKAALAPQAKFCSECGAKVPLASRKPQAPPGERRQVTILFADITGYTRLSSQIDPEELHALLGRYFEAVDGIIRDFGGTVDKHIGDAVMGVFGAPVSHGNDPERAVRAALGIHAAMQRLSQALGRPISVHIGVANGEVVAAATGSDVHREYTVLGDAVNLASRLDGLAGAGETMISRGVQQAVSDLVDTEAGGEVEVKGLSVPVRVFRVRGLRSPGGAFRTPLVGRDAELRQFEQALAHAQTGAGSVLQLRGEPGIGKTRLVTEMRALALQRGFGVHTGLVLDFGTGRGEDAVRSLVLSLFALSLDATLAEREAALQDALEQGRVDIEAQAPARDLLSLPQPPALRGPYEALSEAMRAEVWQRCVTRLVEHASQLSPQLICVEDVHWADASTLGALAAISDLTRNARVLLLVTSRLDGDPLSEAFWSGRQQVARQCLTLSPLAPEAARAIGEQFSGVDSRRLSACVERSGGNPLFLEQLLLSEAEGALPDSVQSLVQARMDRLDARDKRALQAAAVIGQRFSLELLRHLLVDSDYQCTILEERGLLRRSGDDWLFSHALVRDGVYSSLLRQVRRDLHRSAATWFGSSDPVLRAVHLDRAEDEEAPRAYLEAARSRIETLDYQEGSSLLRRGSQLATTPSDRHALALREGELMLYRADSRAAVEAFQRALAYASSDLERCHSHIGMADAYRIVEAVDEAEANLALAERLLEPSGMDAERSRLHRIRGSIRFAQALDSRGDQELALQHAVRSGELELEARAWSCLGDAFYMAGQVRRAQEHFSRCVELCRRHGLQRVELYQYTMLGMTRALDGDCLEALNFVERGIELSRRTGHLRAEMVARETLGLLLSDAGQYERALSELDQALAHARHMGSRMFEGVLIGEKIEVLMRSGEVTRAREAAANISLEGANDKGWFVRPMLLPILAWLAPSHAEMEQILDQMPAARGSLRGGMMMLLFHSRAAEACFVRGNHARALKHATELAALQPDGRYFEQQVQRVRALSAYSAGSREPELLRRIQTLRAEAERGGFGTATLLIDRTLAGEHSAPS